MTRPITLFTGQWADLPFEEVARLAGEWGYDGLEIACWGDHLDASRWDDADYVQSRLTCWSATAQGLDDLESPHGPGGVRRPDRRAPPRHPRRPGLGRRRPGGRAAARGGGDEEHSPDRGEARGEDGHGLHRVDHLEVRRDVPARLGRDDRRRVPGLRRPLEPDPRRVRGGGGAVRPRGAPVGDRLRLLDHEGARSRRSATARRSASTWTRRTSSGRSSTQSRSSGLHASASSTCTEGVEEALERPQRRTGLAPALGRPAPRVDFVSTGHGDVQWNTRSACSTRSATTARSRSSGRTQAWTVWSGRPRRSRSCAGSRRSALRCRVRRRVLHAALSMSATTAGPGLQEPGPALAVGRQHVQLGLGGAARRAHAAADRRRHRRV